MGVAAQKVNQNLPNLGLSYCVFHEIHGLREGTVISALCVGIFMKFWLAGLTKLFKRAPADTQ